MTGDEYLAMGASEDVAEALARSDADLAAERREMMQSVAERTDREFQSCPEGCPHICPKCGRHSVPFGACMSCGFNTGDEFFPRR